MGARGAGTPISLGPWNQKFGLNEVAQIEDAPEYRPGMRLTEALVRQYLTD